MQRAFKLVSSVACFGPHPRSDTSLHGLSLVAIAYLMQKTTYVFPIVGMRKVEQLYTNVEALNITLSPEHIARIEGVLEFKPGFPHDMLVRIISSLNIINIIQPFLVYPSRIFLMYFVFY